MSPYGRRTWTGSSGQDMMMIMITTKIMNFEFVWRISLNAMQIKVSSAMTWFQWADMYIHIRSRFPTLAPPRRFRPHAGRRGFLVPPSKLRPLPRPAPWKKTFQTPSNNRKWIISNIKVTRSSWLNSALRDDEAVYWVISGHYEAVAVGNWWYWVRRGHLCLYILHKVEIWSGVTDAWLTDNFER